jgi:hypothetical protein
MLRADLDAMVESERADMRGHPKREAKAWAEKLAEADSKRSPTRTRLPKGSSPLRNWGRSS